MSDISYQQARRLGLKEVKTRTARHEYPYLRALEDELEHLSSQNEQKLGTFRIDLGQVAGTYTASRRDAFSASFFPLLEESSEFAAKWSALAASHLKEGIREPILVVEYLNRFFVVEGHKRVSVLRYFGALTVRAEVRRLLPARSKEPEILAYYEFLDFYRVTQIQYIVFRTPGRYPALLELLCGEDRSVWDEDRQRCFFSDVTRFRRSFRDSDLRAKLTQDEALLRYLEIFGYDRLQDRTPAEIKADLAAIAPELLSQAGDKRPVLMTDSAEAPRGLIQRIVHPPLHDLKIAFLHDKDPDSSFWTWSHEQGRLAVQEALGDRVETVSRFNVLQNDPAETVRELAEQGFGMIFTTTPRLLRATLTAAAAWPEIRFLNCSLNVSHPIVRSYYGRMYEAKFLTGVIAGAMSINSKIGYICNYPIFSMPASINAFALGAKMVNPEAQIILEWSTIVDADIGGRFERDCVTAVSGSDSFEPARRDLRAARRETGKCRVLPLGLGKALHPARALGAGRLLVGAEQYQRGGAEHQLLLGPCQRACGRAHPPGAARGDRASGGAAAAGDRAGLAAALRRARLRSGRRLPHSARPRAHARGDPAHELAGRQCGRLPPPLRPAQRGGAGARAAPGRQPPGGRGIIRTDSKRGGLSACLVSCSFSVFPPGRGRRGGSSRGRRSCSPAPSDPARGAPRR